MNEITLPTFSLPQARRPILSLKRKTADIQLPPPQIWDQSRNNTAIALEPPGILQAGGLRAMCFFDGQNLYHSARDAFGCDQHVDPIALAKAVCAKEGWRCEKVRYYQGSPDPNQQPDESRFWSARRARLLSDGVAVFDRRVQYIQKLRQHPDGTWSTVLRIKEKGIDLRMALDVLELAQDNAFDVAVLFCRDQDMTELIPSIRRVQREQNRTIQLTSAYPTSATRHLRGIDGTRWLPFDQSMYEACLADGDHGPMPAVAFQSARPATAAELNPVQQLE